MGPHRRRGEERVSAHDDQRDLFQLLGSEAPVEGAAHLTHSLTEPFANLGWYYADNGFRSLEAMDTEHEPVLKLASATLSEAAGNVLDLGCGNGVLLKKIYHSNRNIIPWGVDKSRASIVHACLLNPRFAKNFVWSDLFDDCVIWSEDREFELVILMLGRLREVPEPKAEKLLRLIRERARHFLVYAYDAVVHQNGSLEELARKTGITLSDDRLDENVGIALL